MNHRGHGEHGETKKSNHGEHGGHGEESGAFKKLGFPVADRLAAHP